MVLQTWSPFHHSSDPNMATDCVHAVMTFLQLAGDSPICPARRRSLAIAFFPSFNRMAWWFLRVSWESSQTPSHRVSRQRASTGCSADMHDSIFCHGVVEFCAGSFTGGVTGNLRWQACERGQWSRAWLTCSVQDGGIDGGRN